MSSRMALTNEPDHGTGTRWLSSLARDEKGQVLPFLVLVIVALFAVGMLVFWLGFSTSVATDGQTAADAAALAAEQSVDSQWNSLINVNGVLEPRDSYDTGPVDTTARDWAAKNDATVTSIEYCTQSGGCSPQPIFSSEPDVLVTVATNQKLPDGSPSAGNGSTAQARASVDPYAQASPPVDQSQSSTTCDPSSVPGPTQYTVPTGSENGFVDAPDTRFDQGHPCEYILAAHLDALGKKVGVQLVGIWGAGKDNPAGQGANTPDAVVNAHACGALAEVNNLPASVTASRLADFGLARFPGQSDQIEFASPNARCTTSPSLSPTANDQSASVGNGQVHLVPLTGGPQGALPVGLGSLTGTGPWPAIASYMPIYERIAAQYGWDQQQLQDWLGVEQIEDPAGDLGIAPDKAFGLAQFQTVNYCNPSYGPGDCPADNPTAEQELEAMAAYIHARYGTPSAALAHELANNPPWY